MSASNWDVCPKCLKLARTAVDTQYGKITKEEYDLLKEKLEKLENNTDHTLREDYCQGINNDKEEYFVEYGCRCDECGFSFSYAHKEKVKI
jgi:hypothetical protein